MSNGVQSKFSKGSRSSKSSPRREDALQPVGPSTEDPWHNYANAPPAPPLALAAEPAVPGSASGDTERILAAVSGVSGRIESLERGMEQMHMATNQRLFQIEDDVGNHENWLNDHEDRFGVVLERLKSVEGELMHLKQVQAQNEAMPAAARGEGSSAFDAAPDPCIIIAGCSPNLCEREVILAKVGSIIQGSRIKPGDVKILTKGVRKRFQIKFSSPELACVFMDLMQDDEGEWLRFTVASPQGVQVPVHFNKAPSQKQEKLQVLTGALSKVLGNYAPQGTRLFAHKKNGVIEADFVPVASLSLPNPTDVEVLWNRERTTALNLDTETICKVFKEGGRAKVQWSS
jgi:hypothetical protein